MTDYKRYLQRVREAAGTPPNARRRPEVVTMSSRETILLARKLVLMAIANGQADEAYFGVLRLMRALRASRGRANVDRRARHEAATSLGMRRVRGNLGGIYYE